MKNKLKHLRTQLCSLLTVTTVVFLSPAAFAQTELAKWTFETSVPLLNDSATIDNIAAEIGSGTASGVHASASTDWSNPVGNGSPESLSANTWAVGDYYQFAASTLGQTNISISFDQTGSNTGPGQHNLAYSIDGVNFTVFGEVYTIPPGISWTGGTSTNATSFFFDLSSITELNNQTTVYFRLIAASTVSVNGGTVATGGTCRVDNFAIVANNPGPVSIISDPQPTTANVFTSPSLSVVADGPLPKYQWYKDGTALSDEGNVSGTDTSTLSFSNVVHANAGQYLVVVSNSVNTVTSAPAALDVTGFAIVVDRANSVAGAPVNGNISFVETQSPITFVSATSGNQGILPESNLNVVTDGPTSAHVSMSPVPGNSGVAVVTVTASDGNFTTNASFPLVVVPNSSVLLNDNFEYADGSIGANSGFLWENHGGTVGDLQVISGLLYLSRSASEDVNAELIGQPYAADSGRTLYSKFTVNFNASDTPTSFGTYLAHFKDAAFGYRGRVWASTNASGNIRLGIGNGSDADKNSGEFPLDIVPGQTYTVVTKLVLADDTSTIWINPASESDSSVTATDAVTNGFIDVVSYAFRQNSGMSKLFVDDLVVGTSFAAVTGGVVEPEPIPLNFTFDGNNIVLSWSDPAFVLQAAPQVTDTFTNVVGATSPYTNAVSGSQLFFRLKN